MRLDVHPLRLAKSHPLPIIVARRIFVAEVDAKGFGTAAFGFGDVGLEFYRVYARRCECVDVAVEDAEAAVVGLADFGDEEGWVHGWILVSLFRFYTLLCFDFFFIVFSQYHIQ